MCRTTRPRRDSRRPQRSRSKRKTNPDAGAPSARARHRSHHHSPRRRRLAVVGSALAAAAIAGALFTLPHTGGGFADTTGSSGNFWNSDTLDPPTSLSAADGATVTVDWTATVDSYATGHRIFRSTSTGGPYSQVAEVTPRTTTTYIDNPSPGTYYYVARAYSGGWESVDSNEDSATVAVEDFDAIAAGVDNCPTTFNIDQYDTDGDGTGDACDASPTVASAGAFTDSGQTLGSASSLSVSLADVDGDGDLDAMTANDGAANKVWLNNGSGTYTDSGQNLGSAASVAIGFGDLDGDGDVDAMVANDGAANKVWLNNGSGTFTDSGQSLGGGSSLHVAFADVDGDADLDVMVANNGAGNTVWLNNGSGTFTDSGQSLGTATSDFVAFGDLDGDTDMAEQRQRQRHLHRQRPGARQRAEHVGGAR